MDVSGIDYGAMRFWLSVGQWVFNVMVAWFLWSNRRHQATNTRVERLEKDLVGRVDAAEKDLLTIRGCIDGLPTQQQVKDMSGEMAALSKELGEVKGRLSGINRAVDIINDFLIRQGGQGGGRNGV